MAAFSILYPTSFDCSFYTEFLFPDCVSFTESHFLLLLFIARSSIFNTKHHFQNPFSISTCARAERRQLFMMWTSAILFFYLSYCARVLNELLSTTEDGRAENFKVTLLC